MSFYERERERETHMTKQKCEELKRALREQRKREHASGWNNKHANFTQETTLERERDASK